jgi:hypothetical protein
MSKIVLSIPSVSGTAYEKYFLINYKLDDDPTVYRYTEPIEYNFTKIQYWAVLSIDMTDASQFEIFTWEGI